MTKQTCPTNRGKKNVFRRGIKYPERIINFSKGNISIMFSETASGSLLPPYVVYKAEHLWNTWCERGPSGTRFGRSKSGWMDGQNFQEWFQTIVIPWAKRKEGRKTLIGDNLSSHISPQVIQQCEELNIAFILLPPNAADKLQPLDVSFFAPLKREWRKILESYQQQHPSSTSLNKGVFPLMLNNLIEALGMRSSTNLRSGFRACGIVPLNPQVVLKKLPSATDTDTSKGTSDVSDVVLNYLHQFKYSPHGNDDNAGKSTGKRKRNRLSVSPGKYVSGNSTRIISVPQPSTSMPLEPSTSTSALPQPSTSAPSQPSSSSPSQASTSAPSQPSTSGNGPTCRSRLFQASTAASSDSEDNISMENDSDSFFNDLTDDDEDWVPQPVKRHRRYNCN